MNYTLAFDVYGTLINTSGILNSLEKMVGLKANIFMDTWRNKQLEYSFRRGLMNAYTDFSVCTRDALDFTCKLVKVNLNKNQKEALLDEYSFLPLFDDVKDGLDNLKIDGHKIYAFSNGSSEALNKLLWNAKIKETFDGIISVDGIRTFKPSPLVYEYFNQQTNSKKSASWLISSNPFDVIGAISYGMQAAWLQRKEEAIFDPWDIEPTIIVNKLTDLSLKFNPR